MQKLLIAACVVLAAALCGGEEEAYDLTIWKTPRFKKEFLAGYGVKADIEPGVTTVEKAEMDKILAIMGGKNGMNSAKAHLKRIISPTQSAVFDFTLAGFYFQEGNMETAVKWYLSAIDKYPSFLRAYKNLGQAYIRLGEHEKALAPLTQAIELGANDGTTYGILGFSYLMTSKYASAESAYRRAIMLQPGVRDWKLGLTRCLFKQKKYGDAAALCDEMIDENVQDSDVWTLQANAYLGLNKPMLAAQNYEYLDLMGASTADTLNILGDIYVNSGHMDLALEAYLRGLIKSPKDKAGLYLRNADAFAARGAYAEAKEIIREIRKVFSETISEAERITLLKIEARMAAADGSAGEEQVKLLSEIVKLDPLDGEALILLGKLESDARNMEKAVFYFERAENLEKFAAKALLRHAQCLVKNGSFKDAIPLLKRAQEIESSESVTKYLEQVERVARMNN